MTPSITTLREKLEGASEGSRELDVCIWYVLHTDREKLWAWSGMNGQRPLFKDADLWRAVKAGPRSYGFDDADHAYTTSLDAALALCERVGKPLGVYITRLEFDDEPVANPYYATLCHGQAVTEGDGPTWALALCIAILRALEGK